ncbi:MAG: ribonuclease Y [Bradymonadia bacterium]|jgi:ribonuclease Y
MVYAAAVIALIVGAVAGYMFGSGSAKKEVEDLQSKAEAEGRERAKKLLADADAEASATKKQSALDADKIRLDAEKDAEHKARSRRGELDKVESRLTKREEKLDERASSLDSKQNEVSSAERAMQGREQSLTSRTQTLETREGELDGKLEEIAGLSREDARAELIERITEDAKLYAARKAREIEESALEEADKRAKKILAVTIQRYAGEYVTERTVSVVNLASDDMKGRIIGREGRNIRAMEAATGVDFIIDDTPEAIILSAFDPVRREIARLSLERLMADGRIHPSRIEEVVAKTSKEMDKHSKEQGEAAAFELGLTGLHPEILRYMGRLKYRTSYGQNMWAHSIEVGFLCGLMAGELGLNIKLARRAGFLHDIGKAMDQSDEGGHAIVGANFIKKYGEDDIIVNAVGAHHEEIKAASVIAHLVMAGDALSGARPGARREILESYVKRLEDLERISESFPGVQKSFAVQAGREIRVIVANDKVNDDQAAMLSRDIARRIEDELTYPGSIRVTVIREMRATEMAR